MTDTMAQSLAKHHLIETQQYPIAAIEAVEELPAKILINALATLLSTHATNQNR